MSSIGQSILMALTVTVNKYASLNVQAVHRREAKTPKTTGTKAKAAAAFHDIGRRGLLLSSVVAAPQVNNDDSKTQLLQKYLKKSEENKAKMTRRMDSYYKRNYKDYFDFIEGSLKGKSEQELSESEKGILEWLKTNK